jgi:hypothetical protein
MPTTKQLTLKRLRREGWVIFNTEERISIPARSGKPATSFLRDWGSFADLIGCHPRTRETLAVQATVIGSISARLAKIRALLTVRDCLRAGWRVQVWGWSKDARGKPEVRIVEVTGEELAGRVLENPRRRRPKRHEQLELW